MTGPALLAFDTSTDRLHLGLRVGSREWHHQGESGPAAGRDLVQRAIRLLTEAGVALGRIDAIAFGRGPGAFTGLRSACSTAQGLALGAGKPVLAIDTLMAVAEDARLRAGATDVWVVLDARMEEIHAAHFVHDGERWRERCAPALCSAQDLVTRWQEHPPVAVAGNALSAFGAGLATGHAQRLPQARPGASALLACARAAWDGQLSMDAASAQPRYLRQRVALTTAERATRGRDMP